MVEAESCYWLTYGCQIVFITLGNEVPGVLKKKIEFIIIIIIITDLASIFPCSHGLDGCPNSIR
jgi:hypothetical protein